MNDWTAEWVRQPKLFLSEHLNGHWSWQTERAVGRALTFPRLPRNRQRRQLWGVSVVRDEIDIIDLTIDHLLNQGWTTF